MGTCEEPKNVVKDSLNSLYDLYCTYRIITRVRLLLIFDRILVETNRTEEVRRRTDDLSLTISSKEDLTTQIITKRTRRDTKSKKEAIYIPDLQTCPRMSI